MTAKPNYPDSLCFTRDQDKEIEATTGLGEIAQLAAGWNLHENVVRGRLATLRAFYRRIGKPLVGFKKGKPGKSIKAKERTYPPPPQVLRPRPSRFARPAFFEEDLTLLTKGGVGGFRHED